MTTSDDLATATSIALEAGAIVTSYFRSDRMGARSKGDRDVVTEADTQSERFVLDRLREAFPGDGIVAEEGGSEPSGGGRRWYVDPLDGTVNYSRGLPIWCVSISLFEDDQPVLGVVHDPLRDETFSAAFGEGVWLNDTPIAVSGVSDPAEAFVHLTIDFNDASLHAGLRDIRALAPRVLRTRNIGSAALALAYVAAGNFDAMVHRFANPWDYGAGVLMIREAGGTITDISGAPYSVESVAVLAASTHELHTALSATLSATAAGAR